ncbi:DUF4232 domain-containing protein [Streptacidiphilus fuscans]|uniref:DUF4232 domain-containing protein n=1 Tax=Streptacidiphilus fuscans TaxID=2789292 RepID=A0A931BD10_9ACTN|nr:DUF4232 domain-containing protein [Streptacidiphilus fuscans]MBF9071963.1 DUF4232 domain-containing protein [Streptacidiphilus fuscans]
MRTASRLSAAAVVLAAGLALTACGSSGSGSSANAGGGSSPVASTSASASASTGTTGTTGTTGSTGTTGGSTGGSGSSSDSSAKCTVSQVRMTVTGPAGHANDQQPARATLHVVNNSGHNCTLAGFPGIELADDQGKSSPINAVRHTGMQGQTVTLVPGQSAQADLTFSDINTEGTSSARYVCGVQGSKVQVILPDTTTQKSVPVTGGIDNGTLSVCGTLTVDPFSSLAD